MSRKGKISAEKKVEAVETYLSGKIGCVHAAREAGVNKSSFRRWVAKYQTGGPTELLTRPTNRHYSKETMLAAVKSYLNGEGSLLNVAKKYRIRSEAQLRNWIKRYNAHEEFNPQSGGSHMSKVRQTTQEERLEIVLDCLTNGKNYGAAAIKYNVSYQQVRNWVIRYEAMGAAGLEDRRGKRAGTQSSRTPEEALRDRIAQLERKNKELQMENDLLKKVRELAEKDRYR